MTYVDFILLMVAALLLIWFIMPSSNQPDLAEKVRSGLHLTPLEVNLLARYKTIPQPLPQAGIYRAAYPTTMVKQGMTFVLQHEFEIHPDKATWRRKIWGHFKFVLEPWSEKMEKMTGIKAFDGAVRQWYKKWMGINHD